MTELACVRVQVSVQRLADNTSPTYAPNDNIPSSLRDDGPVMHRLRTFQRITYRPSIVCFDGILYGTTNSQFDGPDIHRLCRRQIIIYCLI